MIQIARTLRSISVMDMDELVTFYWKAANERRDSVNGEHREQIRLLLVVVDAIGELKWPTAWRTNRIDAA